MKKQLFLLALAATVLSGCTSIFGGGGGAGEPLEIGAASDSPEHRRAMAPKLAYVGNLANNRVSQVGETIAYAKNQDGSHTTVYKYKGVDSSGGIHIDRVVRYLYANGRSQNAPKSKKDKSGSAELVFLPEQTLLVSPGIHVVFVRSTPSELHYRVIMTGS